MAIGCWNAICGGRGLPDVGWKAIFVLLRSPLFLEDAGWCDLWGICFQIGRLSGQCLVLVVY